MTRSRRNEDVDAGLRRFFDELCGAPSVATPARPAAAPNSDFLGSRPIGPFGPGMAPKNPVEHGSGARKSRDRTYRISAAQLAVFGQVLGAGTAVYAAAQRVHEAPSPAASKQLVEHLRMLGFDTMRRLAEGLERLDEDRSGSG